MKNVFWAAALLLSLGCGQECRAHGDKATLPDSREIVNAPTAYTLLRGCYTINLRIYEAGGLQGRWDIGLLDRFLLGVGFAVNNVIGSGVMSAETPRLGARLRLLDERAAMPSVAIGWDQRGYGPYDGEHYLLGEKGAYVVAGKEVKLLGVFQLHGGANVVDVQKCGDADDIQVFAGAIAAPAKELVFSAEGEDLLDSDMARLNARIALVFDEMLTVAVEGLDLTEPTRSRMLMIDYKNYF